MKIIQIEGIKGLLTATYMLICLFAGFIMFPGMVAMNLWNKYLATTYMFPVLNLLQGILLWLIISITFCILTKNTFSISYKTTKPLSDAELDMILQKAKIHSQMKQLNTIISKSDKFEKSKINNQDLHIPTPFALKNDVVKDKKEEEKVSDIK